MREKTERVFFTDCPMAEKARSGTMVVMSQGTLRPEIVSKGGDWSAMAGTP